MPDQEKFRLYQIQHFLNSLNVHRENCPMYMPYERWCKGGRTSGGIALLYEIQLGSFYKLPYMLDWEKELGRPISKEVWEECISRVQLGLFNASLRDANYKVLSRWYMVPNKDISNI